MMYRLNDFFRTFYGDILLIISVFLSMKSHTEIGNISIWGWGGLFVSIFAMVLFALSIVKSSKFVINDFSVIVSILLSVTIWFYFFGCRQFGYVFFDHTFLKVIIELLAILLLLLWVVRFVIVRRQRGKR